MDDLIHWFELRISSSLRPRPDEVKTFLKNPEYRIHLIEFLRNEDIRRLYVFFASSKGALAACLTPSSGLQSKCICFLKFIKVTKLTLENIADYVVTIDCAKTPLKHLDLLLHQVYLPLLCTDVALSRGSTASMDKLVDVLHKFTGEVDVIEGLVEGSIVLPIPAAKVLAKAVSSVEKRGAVIHVLESTIIGWIKQIKVVLKHDPLNEMKKQGPKARLSNEKAMWETHINKLKSINEQLDSATAAEIVSSLEQAESAYAHSFKQVRKDINKWIMERREVYQCWCPLQLQHQRDLNLWFPRTQETEANHYRGYGTDFNSTDCERTEGFGASDYRIDHPGASPSYSAGPFFSAVSILRTISVTVPNSSALYEADENFRYLMSLLHWLEPLNLADSSSELRKFFLLLLYTLQLVWTHSRYYHHPKVFVNLLRLTANEVVCMAENIVEVDVLKDPPKAFRQLKEALRVCATFRGSYLDIKAKADEINSKKLEENIHKMSKKPKDSLWNAKLYGPQAPKFSNKGWLDGRSELKTDADLDEWLDSPWPPHCANCFQNMNLFMERCNDVLELVETTRHFRLLERAAEIGGAGTPSLDAMVQDIQERYQKTAEAFLYQIKDILTTEKNHPFEKAFFDFRIKIKELEHQIAGVLRSSFHQCPTVQAQLRLLEVFEGISGREVVQVHLKDKEEQLLSFFMEEVDNVKAMFHRMQERPPLHMNTSPTVGKLMWVKGLQDRISEPLTKLRAVCPHSLEGDWGWKLRHLHTEVKEQLERFEKDTLHNWFKTAEEDLVDALKLPLLITTNLEEHRHLQTVQLNLDPRLILLFHEATYLQKDPFNIKLPESLTGLLRNADETKIRALEARMEMVVCTYNEVMRTIADIEKPLFDESLSRINENSPILLDNAPDSRTVSIISCDKGSIAATAQTSPSEDVQFGVGDVQTPETGQSTFSLEDLRIHLELRGLELEAEEKQHQYELEGEEKWCQCELEAKSLETEEKLHLETQYLEAEERERMQCLEVEKNIVNMNRRFFTQQELLFIFIVIIVAFSCWDMAASTNQSDSVSRSGKPSMLEDLVRMDANPLLKLTASELNKPATTENAFKNNMDILLLTRKFESKLQRIRNIQWQSLHMEACLKFKLVPRGLRVLKMPTFGDSNPELLAKWQKLNLETSFSYIKILINHYDSVIQQLMDDVKTVEHDLLKALGNVELAIFTDDLKRTISSLDLRLSQDKKRKLERDFFDFNKSQVFSWPREKPNLRTHSTSRHERTTLNPVNPSNRQEKRPSPVMTSLEGALEPAPSPLSIPAGPLEATVIPPSRLVTVEAQVHVDKNTTLDTRSTPADLLDTTAIPSSRLVTVEAQVHADENATLDVSHSVNTTVVHKTNDVRRKQLSMDPFIISVEDEVFGLGEGFPSFPLPYKSIDRRTWSPQGRAVKRKNTDETTYPTKKLLREGLHVYTWNTAESMDYAELVTSLVCSDLYTNYSTVKNNYREIVDLTAGWATGSLDIFSCRILTKSYSIDELVKEQSTLDQELKNKLVPDGQKIHTLLQESYISVKISEASPAWQEYTEHVAVLVFEGLKRVILTSLASLLNTLLDRELAPILCVQAELIQNEVTFSPPLDKTSAEKSILEHMEDWLKSFLLRGLLVKMLSSSTKAGYHDYLAVDEEVLQLVGFILQEVQDRIKDCQATLSIFHEYGFLWKEDVMSAFSDFLNGKGRFRPISHTSSSGVNFIKEIMEDTSERSFSGQSSSLRTHSALMIEAERAFILPKDAKDKKRTHLPLLEDFDVEIGAYMTARDTILDFTDAQDIGWIRVDYRPVKQVIAGYAYKWMWTFTKYLIDQLTATLKNLDAFLKRTEPQIENITGEERDTESFMKMMRLFNEVSAKQSEMDVQFAVMQKTVILLEKYSMKLPVESEKLYTAMPGRWSNLKTKVSLAKQRLGPRIQQESQRVTKDLARFGGILIELREDMEVCEVYTRDCTTKKAFLLIDGFGKRLKNLQKEAEDLRELQELLEATVADFSILSECQTLVRNLTLMWQCVEAVHEQQDKWKKELWQNMDIKQLYKSTSQQLKFVKSLPAEVHSWDIYDETIEFISDLQLTLPLIEDLGNPAMKTRHWKQLVRLTGGVLHVTAENLRTMTLGDLLTLGLQKHIDHVKTIVQRAVKDVTIENALKNCEEVWLSKIFDLRPHRRVIVASVQNKGGTVMLLTNTDGIFEELEHHQLLLSTMQNYTEAGSFLDDVTKWQRKLQIIETAVSSWLQAQEKWTCLEEVFSGVGIRVAMPKEATVFAEVHYDFSRLMKVTEENPNILQNCTKRGLQGMLDQMNQRLERCQRALLHHLEKRRLSFPRLFFLSLEDTLNILCYAYDPEILSHYMYKLFEHIGGLEYEQIPESRDVYRVLAVRSFLGEKLKFVRPMECKGPLESWLHHLVENIKVALQHHLHVALERADMHYGRPIRSAGARKVFISAPASAEETKQEEGRKRISPSVMKEEDDESKVKDVPEKLQICDIYRPVPWELSTVSEVLHLTTHIQFTNKCKTCVSEWNGGSSNVFQATKSSDGTRSVTRSDVNAEPYTECREEKFKRFFSLSQIRTLSNRIMLLLYQKDVVQRMIVQVAAAGNATDLMELNIASCYKYEETSSDITVKVQQNLVPQNEYGKDMVVRGTKDRVHISEADGLTKQVLHSVVNSQVEHEMLDSYVANLSNYEFDNDEMSVLKKGLKFVPTAFPRMHEIKMELFRLVRKMHLKEYFHNNKTYYMNLTSENTDLSSDNSFYSCDSDVENNAYVIFDTSTISTKSTFMPPFKNVNIQRFNNAMNLIIEKELCEFNNTEKGYHLSKNECHKLKQLGESKRSLSERIKEHVRDIKNKKINSPVADHFNLVHKGKTDSLMVSQSEIAYGYEYQGSGEHILITPVTERSFVSLSAAVQHGAGALCTGPEATGKKSTIAELSHALGKPVFIFNCTSATDHDIIQDIYKGLAYAGTWICLNGIDQLTPSIQSLAAQLYEQIQAAIHSQAVKPTFNLQTFDGPVNGEGVCFAVTTSYPANQIFSKRQPRMCSATVSLPENLLKCFRIINISSTDFNFIFRMLLITEGQESNTTDIDTEGVIELENTAVAVAVHHCLLPQLTGHRAKLFSSLVVTLWSSTTLLPGALATRIENSDAFFRTESANSMRESSAEEGIALPDSIEETEMTNDISDADTADKQHKVSVSAIIPPRVHQLAQLVNAYQMVAVLGPAGCGKSSCIRAYIQHHAGLQQEVESHTVYMRAMEYRKLLGYLDENTGAWVDGLIPKLLRPYCLQASAYEQTADTLKILHLDGEIDEQQMEIMRSVFCSKGSFVLANSEHLKLPDSVKLFWEAMISPGSDMKFDDMKRCFVFSCAWAFGGLLNFEARTAFSHWWREHFQQNNCNFPKDGEIWDYYIDSDTHQFVKWSDAISPYAAPCGQGIPSGAFIHTVLVEQLLYFLSLLSDASCPVLLVGEAGCGKSSVMREHISTLCSGDVAENLQLKVTVNRSTSAEMLWTTLMKQLEWQHGAVYKPSGNKKLFCLIDDINLVQVDNHGSQPACELVRQLLDLGGVFDPSSFKWKSVKHVSYLSTMNVNTTAQVPKPSLRLLRHFVIFQCHYPSTSDQLEIFTSLLNGHFLHPINEQKVSNLLASGNDHLRDLLSAITSVTIETQERLRTMFLETSDRCHYIFTLRDLSKIFKNICISLDGSTSTEELLYLWNHELEWVDGHRMVDLVDYERFKQSYIAAARKVFTSEEQLNLIMAPQQPLFNNIIEHEGGLITTSSTHQSLRPVKKQKSLNSHNIALDGYQSTFDLTRVRRLLEESLREYNKVSPRMSIQFYKTTAELVCRITRSLLSPPEVAHTMLCGEGCPEVGILLTKLAAHLCNFTMVQLCSDPQEDKRGQKAQQFRNQLIDNYIEAGLKGKKIIFVLTEDEIDTAVLVHITDLVVSGSVSDLFSVEQQATITNAVRSEVTSTGLTYTKETAWQFFLQSIQQNFRWMLICPNTGTAFQKKCLEFPALTNAINVYVVPHWSRTEIVQHAYHHIQTLGMLSPKEKENVSHLLASMHLAISKHDGNYQGLGKYGSVTNSIFEKFVLCFVSLMKKKHEEILENHHKAENVLGEIKAKIKSYSKLRSDLQHELIVVEDQKQGAVRMLEQIAQDKAVGEQQICNIHQQLKKIKNLQKLLPKYELAHEQAIYKSSAILSDLKDLVQQMDITALGELRAMQKPDVDIEELMASIIILLKSPSADLTWSKGAKRQMANLDRFLDELITFDKIQLTEPTLQLLEANIGKHVFTVENMEAKAGQNVAAGTLLKWLQGAVHYYRVIYSKVNPLQTKVQEMKAALDQAGQKKKTLQNKRDILLTRLNDLEKGFEEATIDKNIQQQKTMEMSERLEMASSFMEVLDGECNKYTEIIRSLQERLNGLLGRISLIAALISYLGPYDSSFRQRMLSEEWPTCLKERGLSLVFDSIDSVKGRVIDFSVEFFREAPEENERRPDVKADYTDQERHGYLDDTVCNEAETERPRTVQSLQKQSNSEVLMKDFHPAVIPEEHYPDYIKALMKTVINENWIQEWIMKDWTIQQMENAAILLSSWQRPPVLIDPFYHETEMWFNEVEKKCGNTDVISVRLKEKQEDNIFQSIEKAILTGNNLFLYDFTKKWESLLNPLIDHCTTLATQETQKGCSNVICFNGRRLICSNKFRMHLASSSILPQFSAEISSRTTFINCSPSEESLLEQLLNRAFASRQPELYLELKKTSKAIIQHQHSLHQLEEMFAESLTTCTARNIDSTAAVIMDIFTLKKVVSQKLQKAKSLCDDLLQFRNELLPLARRGVLLFCLLKAFKCLAKEYQFPLDSFLKLYDQVVGPRQETENEKFQVEDIKRSDSPPVLSQITPSADNARSSDTNTSNAAEVPSSEDPEHQETSSHQMETVLVPPGPELPTQGVEYLSLLANQIRKLVDHLTQSIYHVVIQRLHPQHAVLFSSLLCLQMQLENGGAFTEEELNFFIHGHLDYDMNALLLTDSSLNISPLPWLSPDKWKGLLTLSLIPGPLENLFEQVTLNSLQWESWYNSYYPEAEHLPFSIMQQKTKESAVEEGDSVIPDHTENFDPDLDSEFHQLLILRILRPDRLTAALSHYSRKHMLQVTQDFHYPNMNEIIDAAQSKLGILILLQPAQLHCGKPSAGTIVKTVPPKTIICKSAVEMGISVSPFSAREGCENEIEAALEDILKKDSWLLIENLQLASKSFLRRLHHILNNAKKLRETRNLKNHFCVWLTSEPGARFTEDFLAALYKVSWHILAYSHISNNGQLSSLFTPGAPQSLLPTAILSSFDLVNEESWIKLQDLPALNSSLCFGACILHGIIFMLSSLCAFGVRQLYPAGYTQLNQVIDTILFFSLKLQNPSDEFSGMIVKEVTSVYTNLVTSIDDTLYIEILVNDIISQCLKQSGNIVIDHLVIPVPPVNVIPVNYGSWLKDKLADQGSKGGLSLNENIEQAYNDTCAAEFLRELSNVYEAMQYGLPTAYDEEFKVKKRISLLHVSLDLVIEQLPPLLKVEKLTESSTDYKFPYLIQSGLQEPTEKNVKEPATVNYVMFQECQQMNVLLRFIQQQLHTLTQCALGGTAIVPNHLTEVALALQEEEVPRSWVNCSCQMSPVSLSHWITNLKKRHFQLKEWLEKAVESTMKKTSFILKSIWAGGLYNPVALLIALRHEYAVYSKCLLDEVILICQINSNMEQRDEEAQEYQMSFQGLFLQGASWDFPNNYLEDARAEFTPLPFVTVIPILESDLKSEPELEYYNCPIYMDETRQFCIARVHLPFSQTLQRRRLKRVAVLLNLASADQKLSSLNTQAKLRNKKLIHLPKHYSARKNKNDMVSEEACLENEADRVTSNKKESDAYSSQNKEREYISEEKGPCQDQYSTDDSKLLSNQPLYLVPGDESILNQNMEREKSQTSVRK
ncbi:dynein beta chain, flagellar outer arm-like [Protopterus annectens]|uniref:dynein beta chain, flagellar outer arm-like n=1 Tax=Protopterus annectens TaxID=7888 RepID=UPI001CF99E22|nr:dynein beta chain, flagellar outer arm-like [Protopterus annectens]